MGLPELWQVYDSAGGPVVGRGEVADAFAEDFSLHMANSHVWLWRDFEGSRQLLIQKRADHLPRRPGYLHASASGHVNLGERPADAAVREAHEELGVELSEGGLNELFVMQGGPRNESFNYVYTYRFGPNSVVTVNPSEVQSVEWVDLIQFDQMRLFPEDHKLINLGKEYFDMLVHAVERL